MTILYINQKFIEATSPSILAGDRGLLLGDGLFETMRAYSGNIIFLQQHWERLVNSAQVLDIKIPITYEQLFTTTYDLLAKNNLTQKDARVRLTLTRGSSAAGLLDDNHAMPTFIISATPYTQPEAINNITIAKIRRNELSPLANIKSLNYLDNILALKAAHQQNADEALLLNTQGNLACATTANVFVIAQETIYTPRLQDGALPGIMRHNILQLAKQHEIKLVETSISLSQLQTAEEIFLTNSLVGVRKVLRLNNKLVNNNMSQYLQDKLQNYLVN